MEDENTKSIEVLEEEKDKEATEEVSEDES
jgi:hypothetical protein